MQGKRCKRASYGVVMIYLGVALIVILIGSAVLGEEGLNMLAKDSYHAELIDLLTNHLAVMENPMSKGSGNAVSMEQIALWL